ncbi:ATP-binding protein, partial [bacterium]|nr:ATP-binding protein [bacterium]
MSIPESDIEIGGEGGKAALDILAKTIGRIESVWKPVTATESFEIVRRRLFSSEMDYAARDAVLSAFREMYAGNSGEFPSGVAEGDYLRRMKEAYPIHPELFARLYEDWSTLDRFQRTRGVLRLMATVIHRLWQDNDQSLMIMPASIPLWAATVRNEMLRYLPENWPAIVDADIDGEDSKPYQIDKGIPTLGQYTASRRVARAIFVGSAPSVAGQSVRGIEEVRVRLATVQPGEQLAAFNDALRRMSNQLTYLYTDGSRYWYDTRPTVNRMAQDRAQNIHADLVYQEAIDRLRAVRFRREDFAAAHIAPQSSGDVADEWRTRVVVLAPEYGHKKNGSLSQAQEVAKEILENRGELARLYRNMLVFIAPDVTNAQAWEQSLREYLAWKSIDDEAEPLNLDAQQRKQVDANCKRTEETLLARLQETYSWLIVPAQPEPTGPIDYQAHRISGQDSFYDRAARKLRQSELLIQRWSPDNLRME